MTEVSNEDFTQRLQVILDREGWTPAMLSKKTGIPYQTIANVMQTRNKPSFDVIVRIVQSVDWVTADWLMMGVEPKDSVSDNRMLEIIANQAEALRKVSSSLADIVTQKTATDSVSESE